MHGQRMKYCVGSFRAQRSAAVQHKDSAACGWKANPDFHLFYLLAMMSVR